MRGKRVGMIAAGEIRSDGCRGAGVIPLCSRREQRGRAPAREEGTGAFVVRLTSEHERAGARVSWREDGTGICGEGGDVRRGGLARRGCDPISLSPRRAREGGRHGGRMLCST